MTWRAPAPGPRHVAAKMESWWDGGPAAQAEAEGAEEAEAEGAQAAASEAAAAPPMIAPDERVRHGALALYP